MIVCDRNGEQLTINLNTMVPFAIQLHHFQNCNQTDYFVDFEMFTFLFLSVRFLHFASLIRINDFFDFSLGGLVA